MESFLFTVIVEGSSLYVPFAMWIVSPFEAALIPSVIVLKADDGVVPFPLDATLAFTYHTVPAAFTGVAAPIPEMTSSIIVIETITLKTFFISAPSPLLYFPIFYFKI